MNLSYKINYCLKTKTLHCTGVMASRFMEIYIDCRFVIWCRVVAVTFAIFTKVCRAFSPLFWPWLCTVDSRYASFIYAYVYRQNSLRGDLGLRRISVNVPTVRHCNGLQRNAVKPIRRSAAVLRRHGAKLVRGSWAVFDRGSARVQRLWSKEWSVVRSLHQLDPSQRLFTPKCSVSMLLCFIMVYSLLGLVRPTPSMAYSLPYTVIILYCRL